MICCVCKITSQSACLALLRQRPTNPQHILVTISTYLKSENKNRRHYLVSFYKTEVCWPLPEHTGTKPQQSVFPKDQLLPKLIIPLYNLSVQSVDRALNYNDNSKV